MGRRWRSRARWSDDRSSGRRNARVRCVGRSVPTPVRLACGPGKQVGSQRATDGRGPRAAGGQLTEGRRDAVGTDGKARRDRVAAEELVAALAVEEDDHASLARGLHHAPLGVDAERPDRLLLVEDELLEVVGRTLGGGFHRVVLDHLRPLSYLARVGPFVALVAGKRAVKAWRVGRRRAPS